MSFPFPRNRANSSCLPEGWWSSIFTCFWHNIEESLFNTFIHKNVLFMCVSWFWEFFIYYRLEFFAKYVILKHLISICDLLSLNSQLFKSKIIYCDELQFKFWNLNGLCKFFFWGGSQDRVFCSFVVSLLQTLKRYSEDWNS